MKADRQRNAVFVLDNLDHTGVTGEPLRGLRGNEEFAQLAYLDRIPHQGAGCCSES